MAGAFLRKLCKIVKIKNDKNIRHLLFSLAAAQLQLIVRAAIQGQESWPVLYVP